MYREILLERNVAIPMRDGVVLRADVFRPRTVEPLPAILSRTPYDKTGPLNHELTLDAFRAAEAGYAMIFQDTRGRYQSEGEFYPFVHERADGYDSVEWVAGQDWCSGAVGMAGGSYIGATQWLAATAKPPHLRAIAPSITTAEYYEGWTYQGGAFQLGFTLFWTLLNLAPDTARRADRPDVMRRLLAASDEMEAQYRHLPLTAQPVLREAGVAGYYFDWLAHGSNDDYWQGIAIKRHYSEMDVAAYHIGGWYDLFLGGTLENYVGMRGGAPSERARNGQRLLLGPWSHGVFAGVFPEVSYGVFSGWPAIDITALQLRFFDRYLKEEETGAPDEEAPVRLFVMGTNVWRDEHEWPLARTQYTRWHLHSEGNAGGAGGWLSRALPADEPVDVYLYDPRNPAPTTGGPTFLHGIFVGANAGPRDQRAIEARPDVLTYTSDRLEQALEVTGPLTAVLYAVTGAADTDFVVRLCDVEPDGASRILAEGIIRARFREGTDAPRPITPGAVYEYRIDLVATSNVFLPGHRVRVHVSSSSYPRFDANPNTGHALGQDDRAALRPALQTIFHDSERPSHIVLPVIPA